MLKITFLLVICTSHCLAQFNYHKYANLPIYDGEDSSEDYVNSKLTDSELYDRYRIRRQFMPQRFGKRYAGFIPQRFGKRLYEKTRL
ncbi:hypothetical protein EWB00_011193 [Schistosoma japonicum]|uniref:Uncharacterized protein n=1 Tax=Schistosoma japonicum TaxID=6182 RepID=A0A4Z2DLJ2_SCHJA|nr:hypothetical protein EWB00_011193 [Schistosoma japonicum]